MSSTAPTTSNRIPFRPLYDQVVFRQDEPPTKIGLIHVPETVRDRMLAEATSGVVVAVGPGRYKRARVSHKIEASVVDASPYTSAVCSRCGEIDPAVFELCPKLVDTNEREPVDVAVGDRVWFHPKAGTHAEIDGVTYIVAWDDEALAHIPAEEIDQ